ncbi:MAG: SMP-30/gluconolactonase/LRE family protein [Bacteroidota bacterium]
MTTNALAHTLSLDAISWIGRGLVRPECVVVGPKGTLYTADWRGGVASISPDGAVNLLKADVGDGGPPLQPNGIARLPDGSFLLADLSDARAGVWQLAPDGRTTPFLRSINGQPVPPANFVLADAEGRVWITFSTRVSPRALDYRLGADSGFIVLVDNGRARIVADGLGYANECRLSPDGSHLYVNETFGRRTTRFRIAANNNLVDREPVVSYGPGTFPDGLAFDHRGRLWVTSIVSNRVLCLDAHGALHTVLEDADFKWLAEVEEAFQSGTMARSHLDTIHSRTLRSISSIAFDGDRAYLGCLLGDAIATFELPA